MNKQSPWLIIGGDGLIGAALMEYLRRAGRPVLATTRRPERSGLLLLDLAGPPASWTLPENVAVAFICAAVPVIARCESFPVETRLINTEHTVQLAQLLAQRGALVVFLSSDKVFDGSKPRRGADEAVCPRTEYGRQKAVTETAILALGAHGCVVRLTKVFGKRPALLTGWERELRNGNPIRPFSDMTLAPVTTELVTEALEKIGEKWVPGIMQISGPEDVTYAQAARHLARMLGAQERLVQPVPAAAAGLTPPLISAFTSLNTSRLERELGLTPPDAGRVVEWAIGR